jgi:hypothetical protein
VAQPVAAPGAASPAAASPSPSERFGSQFGNVKDKADSAFEELGDL